MSADATTVSGPTTSGAHAEAHHGPTDKLLWKIAAILAAITAVEVAWSYLPWSDWGHGFAIVFAEVGGLMIMMAVKFFMVAWYFMHLKFDSKLLMWTFAFAMIISVAVFIGTWLMQHHDAVTQFTGDMSI